MTINYLEIAANDTININDYSALQQRLEKIDLSNETRLVDLLLSKFPNGFEFESVVTVNGIEISVEHFDMKLYDNDKVVVSSLPGWNFVISIVINIAISYLLYELNKPKEPFRLEGKSVYSAKTDQVESRLGEPIQIQYGAFRQYPKLIANGYKVFENNIEYHVLNTCLGYGDYNIDKVFLNDTPITELQNGNHVQYYKQGKGSKVDYVANFRSSVSELSSNKIGLISHKPSELENVEINPKETSGEDNKIVGYHFLNEKGTEINKTMISVEFRNGAFATNSGGSDVNVNINFVFEFRQIDDDDEETGYVVTKPWVTTLFQRTPYRNTFVYDLPSGRYKLKITRSDFKEETNTYKDCTITNVTSIERDDKLYYADNVTLMGFIVKVGEGFSSSSGLKVNVESTRAPENGFEYNTLFDFVKDIWTNTDYGMGENISYLEIRADLTEPISLVVDKKIKAYDLLSETLKSYGYLIVPGLNKFIIKKDEKIEYESILFTSQNCEDISFTFKLLEKSEEYEGISVRYIPEGKLNYESVEYPSNMKSYEEVSALGVSTYDQALNLAINIYSKKTLQLKTAHVKTDLEGLIPEIGSRVGVSTEYLEDNYVIEGDSIVSGVITLKQRIKLNANQQYYAVVETEDNEVFPVYAIDKFLVDTFTDTITLTNSTLDLQDKRFAVAIGDKVNVNESYIVTSIKPSEIQEDINSPAKVELTLSEYVPEVYN